MELSGKTLYHGTVHEFTEIDLSKCDNALKDFGTGFYLTSEFRQACSWATTKKGSSNLKARVYRYEVVRDLPENLKIYELLSYNEEWLKCIVSNRGKGTSIVDDRDIVYDRMADSRWRELTAAIKQYESREIDAESALKVLKFKRGKRDQFCFKTELAISLLQPDGCYIVGEGWNK